MGAQRILHCPGSKWSMTDRMFKAIRDYPEQVAKAVHWTPYSRQEYADSQKSAGNWTQSTWIRTGSAVCEGCGTRRNNRSWCNNYCLSSRPPKQKKKPHVFKKREVLYNMERIAAKGCNPQVYISKGLTNVT